MKLDHIQFKANIGSILWMIVVGQGMSYYPKDYVYKGYSLGNGFWLGRKSKGYFFCGDNTTRLSGLITHMKEELIKDPLHIAKVRKIFDERIKEREDFMNFLEEGDLSYLPDDGIMKAYDDMIDTYCYIYPYGEPVTFVTKDFADYLKPLFKGTEEEFYEMISPRVIPFLQREERDMLEIALSSKAGRDDDEIVSLLNIHEENYAWIPFDYGGNVYDYSHFRKELAKLLSNDYATLQKRYTELKGYEDSIRRKQEEISKRYGLAKKDDALYDVVRISYYLIDSKKEYFTKIHFFSEKIFKEIARRLNVDVEIVRHMLPEETRSFLIRKEKVDLAKMKARIENYYFKIKDDGTYDFFEADDAKKVIDEFILSYEQKVDDAVAKGRCAQQGVVTGRARVIMNALACHRVKHGDILITPMTSPDFMVAVKRASAIVTDEGGITCHAAIVSRELKIPCIIGTGNATKVFRDDDEIEVDADKGLVRKIG